MHEGHATQGGQGLKPIPKRHAGHDISVLRRKFWVALLLTLPVVFYSSGVQSLLHFTAPEFPGSRYIPFLLGTFIFFYGGVFFLKGASVELEARQPGMMTLISLAITVAFAFSLAVTFGYPGEALYWELSTLITVMLFGHWMEMEAVGRARGALQELARLMPDEAERVIPGDTEIVPVGELRKGDIVLVRPGSKIPADGEVVEGESSVNEAMITGESLPVAKKQGSQVVAGTINGDGSLRVRVTKIGDETVLAGIIRLVEEAQESRSEAQSLADRAAYWLTLTAIISGAVTFTYWFISPRPTSFAVERAVTVLVIACPHALGLAIPLVIAISTAIAARNGLLIRDRMALEMARDLDVVVFDKTGTLTRGEPGVVGIYPVSGMNDVTTLALAAAVERDSEHMLAKSIVRSAAEQGIALSEARGFRALPGLGSEAEVGGRKVRVGGPKLLDSLHIVPPPELSEALQKTASSGQTLVYLIEGNDVRAAISLADVIRPESREAVDELKRMGIEVAMMTGDSEEVARWVAGELGISEYYANILPEDKARWIRTLRSRGRKTAMVGDGVNDAPALASADVGIAIGAGTDVAIESGGIILVRNDPRDVAKIIRLSKASYRKMLQNLFWATYYNVIAIPLAAGVLANQGIILPPALGALFMSISTVIVATNAQLLKRLRL